MIVSGELNNDEIVMVETYKKELKDSNWKSKEEYHIKYDKNRYNLYVSIIQFKKDIDKFTNEQIAEYLENRFTRNTNIEYIINEIRKGDINHWFNNIKYN